MSNVFGFPEKGGTSHHYIYTKGTAVPKVSTGSCAQSVYRVASRSFVGDAPLLGLVVGLGRVAVIDFKPLGLV